MRFTLLPLILTAVLPGVLSAVVPTTIPLDICHSPTVVSEKFAGENQDVKVQVVQCDNPIVARDNSELTKRQANVCGATCTPIFFSVIETLD